MAYKIFKSIVFLPFLPMIVVAGLGLDDLEGIMKFYYPILGDEQYPNA